MQRGSLASRSRGLMRVLLCNWLQSFPCAMLEPLLSVRPRRRCSPHGTSSDPLSGQRREQGLADRLRLLMCGRMPEGATLRDETCRNGHLRVAEAKSFSGAARRLGISKSLVSKEVAKLEKTLGARLLNRT